MKLRLMMFAVFVGFFSQAWGAEFVPDKTHTNVSFDIDHLVINTVKGRFTDYSGKMEIDDKTGALVKIEAAIKTKSINTDESDRDKHLRSADFFDVEKYPEITFVSDKFDLKPGKSGKVSGKLTMKGVTKDLEFDAEYKGAAKDPWGNEKAAFKLKAKLNRKDFGLNWNKALEFGGVLVGEEVRIEVAGLGDKKLEAPAKETKKQKK